MSEAAVGKAVFGDLLRGWRRAKRHSQLDLALLIGTTTRHLSFLETGRSNPSRDMIVRLSGALEIPMRERNTLFRAAGYAEPYQESAIDSDQMRQVKQIVDMILENHEPYPGLVIDRTWTLLYSNGAMQRILAGLIDFSRIAREGSINVLDLTFHPEGLRPFVVNWDEAAGHMIQRVHREALDDRQASANLKRLMDYPGIPEDWWSLDVTHELSPVMPLTLNLGGNEVSLVSAVTTFGTPQDVTVEELRIELLFPADVQSEAFLKSV